MNFVAGKSLTFLNQWFPTLRLKRNLRKNKGSPAQICIVSCFSPVVALCEILANCIIYFYLYLASVTEIKSCVTFRGRSVWINQLIQAKIKTLLGKDGFVLEV